MRSAAVKVRDPQYDLFSTPEARRAREDSLSRRERYEQRLAKAPIEREGAVGDSTRLQHVRGFIELTLRREIPVAETGLFLARRLACLGGFSLEQMIVRNWPMVQAWMKEVKMYPGEREWHLAEFIGGSAA